MQSQPTRGNVGRGRVARVFSGAALFAMGAVSAAALASAGQWSAKPVPAAEWTREKDPGFTSVQVFKNDRLDVNRMTSLPGHRTDPLGKTHPESYATDVLVIMLTPGYAEISTAGEPAVKGYFEAGKIWFWPKPPATHSFANIGNMPFDYLTVHLDGKHP